MYNIIDSIITSHRGRKYYNMNILTDKDKKKNKSIKEFSELCRYDALEIIKQQAYARNIPIVIENYIEGGSSSNVIDYYDILDDEINSSFSYISGFYIFDIFKEKISVQQRDKKCDYYYDYDNYIPKWSGYFIIRKKKLKDFSIDDCLVGKNELDKISLQKYERKINA